MNILTLQITTLLGVGLTICLIALWSMRHATARLLITALFAGFIVAVFLGATSLLSRAKPVTIEWLRPQVEEATILSGHLVENVGIYLTLVWGDSEPRLYVMPWDRQTAEQLQQALAEAERNGTKTMMKRPFETSQDDQEPLFYAQPQPKLPDKIPPKLGIHLG